ncbi:MAG: hypothetical protein JSS32_07190 [Verrucomicrobia bacterium]|nr:hypothetical protein [Verrucomicrobiota bacterium]
MMCPTCFLKYLAYLFVSVQDLGPEIAVKVETETRTSMTTLRMEECRMAIPTPEKPGVLELKVETDPDALHLWAFGSHKGNFHFKKGGRLPSLPIGNYELWVNGTCYGPFQCKQGSNE